MTEMEMAQVQRLAEEAAKRLFVEMEASGRHVHVTKEQALTLFGHPLTPLRPLSQPGQFLAQERVAVTGPKGEFRNVAVLGPERQEGQVELSWTDGRVVGLELPVRLSGQTAGSPGAVLTGPVGTVYLTQGVIAAQRHIHLTPEDAERFSVADGQTVKLQTYTARPVVFGDVAVRVSREFASFVHLDYDEANACGFRAGDLGRILP